MVLVGAKLIGGVFHIHKQGYSRDAHKLEVWEFGIYKRFRALVIYWSHARIDRGIVDSVYRLEI